MIKPVNYLSFIFTHPSRLKTAAEQMKKTVSYLSFIMLTAGVSGFLFTIIVSPFLQSLNIDLPLIGIQGVVEQNNKIYIGTGPFLRIQVYDLEGNYTGFKGVENVSQNFYFEIDKNGIPRAQTNVIPNFVASKYLCKGGITYKAETIIPLRLKCYAKRKTVLIKQSVFKYLWFPPVLWGLSAAGLIFFFFTNMYKLLDIGYTHDNLKTKFKRIYKEILT